jgi:hypothetical protein
MIKVTDEDLGNTMTEKTTEPKRRYWINTVGKNRLCMSFLTREPSFFARETYLMKECNRFSFYLFKYLKINMVAENKLAWLKSE